MFPMPLRQTAMATMMFSGLYPLGMKSLKYFKVYNRRGQLDILLLPYKIKVGMEPLKARHRIADVYVWIVEGVNYHGPNNFSKRNGNIDPVMA